MRVKSIDERGASLVCENADGADAGADAAGGAPVAAEGGGAPEAMLGWVALPNGRLWPLGDDHDDDDEAGAPEAGPAGGGEEPFSP